MWPTISTVSPFAVHALLETLAHHLAEVLRALFHIASTKTSTPVGAGETVMEEPGSGTAATRMRRQHRMRMTSRCCGKDMLAELGSDLRLLSFAADCQRDFVAFFLGAHQRLKLLKVHDALVAEQNDHVVLLDAGFLRGAAFHHIFHHQAETLGKTRLSGDFRRESVRGEAEIGHRLWLGCLRPPPMFVARAIAMLSVLTITAMLARLAARVVLRALAVAAMIAIPPVFAIRTVLAPGGGRFRRLDGFLVRWRRPFLGAARERTRRDCAAREQKNCQFGFHVRV